MGSGIGPIAGTGSASALSISSGTYALEQVIGIGCDLGGSRCTWHFQRSSMTHVINVVAGSQPFGIRFDAGLNLEDA